MAEPGKEAAATPPAATLGRGLSSAPPPEDMIAPADELGLETTAVPRTATSPEMSAVAAAIVGAEEKPADQPLEEAPVPPPPEATKTTGIRHDVPPPDIVLRPGDGQPSVVAADEAAEEEDDGGQPLTAVLPPALGRLAPEEAEETDSPLEAVKSKTADDIRGDLLVPADIDRAATAEDGGGGKPPAPATLEGVLPPTGSPPSLPGRLLSAGAAAEEKPLQGHEAPPLKTTKTSDARTSQAPSPDAAAAQPQQTMRAAGETDTAAEQVATPPPPPPDQTPSQEKAPAPAADAEAGEQQLPAPQQAGGAAAGEASSAHKVEEEEEEEEEEKEKEDSKAAVQEGSAEKKPPPGRLWGLLRTAVRLLFNRSKGAAGDQSAPPPDGKGGGETTKPAETDGDKQPASPKEDEEKKPAKKRRRKDGAGVPADPAKDKDDEEPSGKPHPPERRKSLRRTKSQASAGAGNDDGKATPQCPPVKKLQKAGRRVVRIMSWYNRHRSQQKDEQPPGAAPGPEDGNSTKTTEPAAAGEEGKEESSDDPQKKKKKLSDGNQLPAPEQQQQENKPHPKWAEEEKRLESILEEAFTRLLATEYTHQLKPTNRKCLLTFSVFNLASEVKKQTMVYWWVSEFHLPHRRRIDPPPNSGKNSAPDSPKLLPWKIRGGRRKVPTAPAAGTDSPTKTEAKGDGGGGERLDAEGVMSKLSDLGFLQPIKNYCCGGIHGCKVNPLVHWMVKRLARDGGFADLDDDGNPTKEQSTSGILCLTKGCRDRLHEMRMAELQAPPPSITTTTKGPDQEEAEESSTQAENKPSRTPSDKKDPTETAEKMGITTRHVIKQKAMKARSQSDKEVVESTQATNDSEDVNVVEFKEKCVILNVDAHVYPLSKSLFKHLSDYLVVLQLGRWCHHDNKTYMEVDGLESESQCAINKLKNLRYLSLRGLSRISKLPCGIKMLKNLEILDMRGCQNLVTVASKDISPLKHLTHIDLTECYMLEHIGREITSLPYLQVFKGFVFGSETGTRRCRVRDLKRLKKLQKLSINITTDANIGRGDMEELESLNTLQSLTITWSEIPSILEDASKKIKDKREELLKTWTTFELPLSLVKLDLRCYPKKDLDLKKPNSLKKLYLRGGEVENIFISKPNSITTLRLRYLKNLVMTWEKIISLLDAIEHVEIKVKDESLLKLKDLDEDDKKFLKKEIEEESNLLEKIKIPESILDKDGVWIKDNKEEENQATLKCNEDAKIQNNAQGDPEKNKVPGFSSGSNEVPSNNDAKAIPSANKVLENPRKHDNDGDDTSTTQAGNKDQVSTHEVSELQTKEDS